jgi:hypothetical protein
MRAAVFTTIPAISSPRGSTSWVKRVGQLRSRSREEVSLVDTIPVPKKPFSFSDDDRLKHDASTIGRRLANKKDANDG